MPFRGATPRETLDLQLNAVPPSLAELLPGEKFPPALEEVVQRCLAKEPGHRYADMKQLIEALRRARPVSDEELTGSLVLPAEVRPGPRSAIGAQRLRQVGLAVAGAAIVLGLGLAAWLLGLATAPVAPPDAPPTPTVTAPKPEPTPEVRPEPAPPPEEAAPPKANAAPARPAAPPRSTGRRETPRPARRPAEPKPTDPTGSPSDTKKKPEGYMDMPDF
jgi:hypothetical protein